MKRRFICVSAVTVFLVGLCVASTSSADAQEPVGEAPAASTAVPPEPATQVAAEAAIASEDVPAQIETVPEEGTPIRSAFRRRLPNYYSRVVDEAQREAIYGIQEEYFDQIASLRARIAALELERDKKIEEVLTPEQLTEVRQNEDAAKLERERRAAQR